MITQMNRRISLEIKNPVFFDYVSKYLDIYDDFMKQIESFGLEISQESHLDQTEALRTRLGEKGAIFRNDDRSIYLNQISPACIACRKGVGSATFFISLQCNRDCFFCFNPNQERYEYFIKNKRNPKEELNHISESGQQIHHLALTGGEPLLHKEEAIQFFSHAVHIFPDAHTRIYTSGDFIDAITLQELKNAGLQEIRFSIRLYDRETGIQKTMERIALAKDYIPSVMVEMPVLPGTLEAMKGVLDELNRIGIFSINLLEFCFPFRNAKTFRNKGYQIRNPPYRILYNYWYAGGLPIAGSELECLQLMEYAIDQGLQIGVHYCSLENKHSGQIYQQNYGKKIPTRVYFSEKDFFYKTAKVFGDDIPKVLERFRTSNHRSYFIDTDHKYMEFHVSKIPLLYDLDVEVGISSAVMETREDGEYIRELKVDYTSPGEFDLEADM